ncbi:MAG TPA: 2-C-methyl-D-erythritol 4-phosphate cytidylyltransferase [Oscillospiraceae bacterium]|nr:2-C-methyl-D-erythritol 4-phosphate cytidylyltransferase [Oscillospiraceae bacterium]
MVIAAVLAGGIGSRMGSADLPKQFLPLAGVPIIARTVKKFADLAQVDKVLVLTPADWVEKTEELLASHIENTEKITVLPGGADRSQTLGKILEHIKTYPDLAEDTVVLTHDAVRPLLTDRIILENIELAKKYGACGTYIPAVDTIAQSGDGMSIDGVPPRSEMYLTQTPQSFNFKRLYDHFFSLTEEEKAKLTDACMIFTLKGEKVYIVKGESSNIKITYPRHLLIAQALLEDEG